MPANCIGWFCFSLAEDQSHPPKINMIDDTQIDPAMGDDQETVEAPMGDEAVVEEPAAEAAPEADEEAAA